jgi:NAD(P)H-quinone oxidoreductase subunit 2
MIFGCVGAYNEDSIKKFIAYSSINQIGFLLIGIVCGTFEGIQATVIYLLVYIAMNMCFLQFYLNTFYVEQSKNIEYLTELKHFSKNN